MILNAASVIERLIMGDGGEDPLIICPTPDAEKLKESTAASIDLRLGTWFLSMRTNNQTSMEISREAIHYPPEESLINKHFCQFGKRFILHPGCFILAVTLEWIRLPRDLAGYVTGKSSWGRRGLVIETAPGVHPGFSGCLTLELANVGEVPIALVPGMPICQLFIHNVQQPSSLKGKLNHSSFNGRRQPILGKIKQDEFVNKLES